MGLNSSVKIDLCQNSTIERLKLRVVLVVLFADRDFSPVILVDLDDTVGLRGFGASGTRTFYGFGKIGAVHATPHLRAKDTGTSSTSTVVGCP